MSSARGGGGAGSSPESANVNIVGGSLGRSQSHQSTQSTSNASHIYQSPLRQNSTGGFSISRMFRAVYKDKDQMRDYSNLLTPEGSVSKAAMDKLGSGSTTKVRLETFKQLQENRSSSSPSTSIFDLSSIINPSKTIFRLFRDNFEVMKSRNLQVSTLEGIYHESLDMLSESGTREPTMRALIDMTVTQHTQLGLALRHTFFEKIREIGCEELTLKWLDALSNGGKNVNGFEKAMDFLVADWVKFTLSERDHPLAMRVLQLAETLISHNAPFICEATMTTIVHSVCVRACRTMDPLANTCLDVLDCVLKYSDLPRTELVAVVTTLCTLVVSSRYRQQAWGLTRALLASKLGYRTRALLLDTLERKIGTLADYPVNRQKCVLMLRGAVFCIANSNWGIAQVDTIRCSPATIIPYLEKAMKEDEAICSDVLSSLRRLIQKHGRDLTQITWIALIGLFESVIKLCDKNPEYRRCETSLHQLLLLTEQLYKDGQFTASPDLLFGLIEKCADRRPDSSVIALIEYRANNITPLQSNWIEKMTDVVKEYIREVHVKERRVKAVGEMHAFYTRYRVLYENELINKLMIPILQHTGREQDTNIQYQLINVLFDVAKTVSIQGTGNSTLFEIVLDLIQRLFNSSVTSQVSSEEEMDGIRDSNPRVDMLSMDNLEIMAQGVGEIMGERWQHLNLKSINRLISILIDHVTLQYQAGWNDEMAAHVRTRAFQALLSIHACPISSRLVRIGYNEDPPGQKNMFVALVGTHGRTTDTGFMWIHICKMVTEALRTENCWSVIQGIIEMLGNVLVNIQLVRTAGDRNVDALTNALVSLYERARSSEIDVKDDIIAKYLPPVLSTLLNYTSRQENKNKEVCRVLVDCVKHESCEALLAVDVAVQLVPSSMAGLAHVLMDHLVRIPPTAPRSIPLMELLSDSAEIPEFHSFFQEKQFKAVADTLAPYTNIHRYNSFVVAAVHRVLMRWFVQVPDNLKTTIKLYIEDAVRMSPYLAAPETGVSRQPSGDGRQVPGALFLLGGPPETPPPMDGVMSKKGPATMLDEVQKALSTFFRMGKIDEDECSITFPEKYQETTQEHYFLNDTIITVRTLVMRLADTVAMKDDDGDVFRSVTEGEDSGMGISPPPSNLPVSIIGSPPSTFNEQRRRFQSAAAGRILTERPKPLTKARDDLYATGGPHQHRRNSVDKVPMVAYTQYIVRHMYGKKAWLMRAMEEWPEDFDRTTSVPAPTSSLLHHIANCPGAVKLGRRSGTQSGPADDINLRLRNLDRIPGIEIHAVGVVYVGPDQTTEAQILANVYGSDRYANFIKLLGEPVALESGKCLGGLEYGKHGQYTYVYKDELSRIIFLIATLMPCLKNDPNCNAKKALIGNNFISIVFNESGRPFELGRVGGEFAHVVLEVIPYNENCLFINVLAKREVSQWLATKRVLLTDKCAARLLRKMAVRTQLSVSSYRSQVESPDINFVSNGVDRLRKIIAIKEKCSVTSS